MKHLAVMHEKRCPRIALDTMDWCQNSPTGSPSVPWGLVFWRTLYVQLCNSKCKFREIIYSNTTKKSSQLISNEERFKQTENTEFFREYQQPVCPWNATQPAVLSAVKCEIGSIEPCRSVVISWPSRTDAADFSKLKVQFLMYCICMTFVTSQYVQLLVRFMLYNSGMSDCLHTRSSKIRMCWVVTDFSPPTVSEHRHEAGVMGQVKRSDPLPVYLHINCHLKK